MKNSDPPPPDARTTPLRMNSEGIDIPPFLAVEEARSSAPPLTDVARVARAGRGDAADQAWLMKRVLPRVRRIARTFLPSSADADDAAQSSLLAILRSASTYRGEAAIEGWAGRIAVRTTLRFLAEQRRDRSTLVREPDEELDADEPAAPFDAPSSEALPRDVREYLELLPEAQHNAILLHHALDFSLSEIAEATGVSLDTVKSRLRLGLATLRKHIRRDIALGPRNHDD